MGRFLVLTLAACGRIAFDPIGTSGDDTGPPIDGASLACSTNPSCPGQTIPLFAGGNGSASTSTGDHGFSGSCGGNSSPEAVWKLRPITAGTFTLAVTEGGPALLVLRDGCCTGPEVACVFDAITFSAEQEQLMFLSVESLGPSVTLSID